MENVNTTPATPKKIKLDEYDISGFIIERYFT